MPVGNEHVVTIDCLAEASVSRKAETAQALWRCANLGALPILTDEDVRIVLKCSLSEDPFVRIGCVGILAAQCDQAHFASDLDALNTIWRHAGRGLQELSTDVDPRVRELVASCYGRFVQAGISPPSTLLPFVNDREIGPCLCAAAYLSDCEPLHNELAISLERFLISGPKSARKAASNCLCKLGDVGRLILEKGLGSDLPLVRLRCASELLGDGYDSQRLLWLAEELLLRRVELPETDEGRVVTAAAAGLIAEIGSCSLQSLVQLGALKSHSDARVRRAAVWALSRL